MTYSRCVIPFLFLTGTLFAQTDSVVYSRELKLKEGVYLNYESFKKNKPIPKAKIISVYDKSKIDFLESVVTKDKIIYMDDAGIERAVKTDDVWGYYENSSVRINFVYNNYSSGFQKVQVIGSICHFTASVQFYANDPMDGGGFSGSSRYYKEIKQFVIDFPTGKIFEFGVASMEVLLKKDEALYKEFFGLPKRKKRDLIFFYLRKFNEKYPVYFPK